MNLLEYLNRNLQLRVGYFLKSCFRRTKVDTLRSYSGIFVTAGQVGIAESRKREGKRVYLPIHVDLHVKPRNR